MPKAMEAALKRKFGADSKTPYKIMNAEGFMHGNKITAKGRKAEKKHMRKVGANRGLADTKTKKRSNPHTYEPSGLIRGLGGERSRAAEKSKKKRRHTGPTFAEAMNR